MGQSGSDADFTHIGRYRIEGTLGAGGVGMVYAAHDPKLDRRVAVKLLRSDRLRSDIAGAQERLRDEAQAMARLAHPNVVTVFDVGEHDGAVYIAMELVEGISLREWLRETPRPWREVLSMYFQAGRGLAAAHEAGLVHRDFKPANVLVGRDGRARVVDFGLASSGSGVAVTAGDDDDAAQSDVYHQATRLTDIETTVDELGARPVVSVGVETTGVFQTQDGLPLRTSPDVIATLTGVDLTVEGTIDSTADQRAQLEGIDPSATIPSGRTRSGLIAGTPAYMAPELFLGRSADARSDQFAFCVALFEGLYGERPFLGATAAEIADEVLGGRVQERPPHTRVPLWIHRIIEQGLATHRAERHESIRSMLASIAFLARVVWN